MAFVSTSQEIELGNEHYAKLQKADGGLDTAHPAVTAYVAEVGKKLAAVCDRKDLPFEFVILDNGAPNAWTLPGGKIAVNRGLLVELRSEAELAAVLSHEIVHAAARHGAKSMERGLLALGAIAGTQAVLQEQRHKELLGVASIVGAELIMLRYSRQAELEADRYGMIYMARAGYDPSAAVTLQEMFVRLADKEDSHWLQGWLLSHPPTRERLEANRKTAAELGKGGFVGAEEYENVMRELRQ